MRLILGMILGAALTVGIAYFHDNTGASASGTTASRQMVNWEVVNDNMRTVRARAHEAWTSLQAKVQG